MPANHNETIKLVYQRTAKILDSLSALRRYAVGGCEVGSLGALSHLCLLLKHAHTLSDWVLHKTRQCNAGEISSTINRALYQHRSTPFDAGGIHGPNIVEGVLDYVGILLMALPRDALMVIEPSGDSRGDENVKLVEGLKASFLEFFGAHKLDVRLVFDALDLERDTVCAYLDSPTQESTKVDDPTGTQGIPGRTNENRHGATESGSAGDPSGHVFRKEGETWRMTFEGKTQQLKDRIGYEYIRRLMEKANEAISIHELELSGLVVERASIQPTLDASAREDYEARLIELAEEIDAARRNGDFGEQEKHEKERSELVDMLAKEMGPGGKSRKMSDETNKCRVRVGNAIKMALIAIERRLPGLAKHLNEALSCPTGVAPCYKPANPINWVLYPHSGNC